MSGTKHHRGQNKRHRGHDLNSKRPCCGWAYSAYAKYHTRRLERRTATTMTTPAGKEEVMNSETFVLFFFSTVIVFLYAIAGSVMAASDCDTIAGKMFSQAVLLLAAVTSAALMIIHFSAA